MYRELGVFSGAQALMPSQFQGALGKVPEMLEKEQLHFLGQSPYQEACQTRSGEVSEYLGPEQPDGPGFQLRLLPVDQREAVHYFFTDFVFPFGWF